MHESGRRRSSPTSSATGWRALNVGRGQDDGVDVGPLINDDAVESVGELVTDAVHDGATLVTRRQAARRARPLLPADRAGRRTGRGRRSTAWRSSARSRRSPRSATEEEAVERANATEYGLVAYVYTRDLARTVRMAESLDFGMVGVNTGLVSNPAAPFGGVKASGFGREGGFEGIEEYLDTTYVAHPRVTDRQRAWSRSPAPSSSTASFGRDAERDSPASPTGPRGVVDDRRCWRGSRELPQIKQQPNLVFAAARWHGVPAPGPYAGLRDALLGDDGTIRATILARATQTNEAGRLATLMPAFAGCCRRRSRWRWWRSGPAPGCASTPTATPTSGSTEGGDRARRRRTRGSSAASAGRASPGWTELPEVAWRGGIDLNPLDVTDADAMAWLTDPGLARARRPPGSGC